MLAQYLNEKDIKKNITRNRNHYPPAYHGGLWILSEI